MPISIAAMFFAFAFAGAVAQAHKRLGTPSSLIVAVTVVLVALDAVALMAMPFYGILTELPLVLFAPVAASGVFALLQRGNERILAGRKAAQEGHAVEFRGAVESATGKLARTLTLDAILALVLFFPTMGVTMFMLVSRLNYACWLRWSCDGQIVQVTRDAGNHSAPMLFVETDGRTEHFSQVDDVLWSQAKVGQHLKKTAGTPWADLDGRPVRMVPLQVKWWNDAR